MTDKEKLQLIKNWVDESISQGNAPIIIHAIRDIINQPSVTDTVIKLSEKSLQRLRSKRNDNL